MTGLPASGKSTFAKTLDAVRFNLDELRLMHGLNPDKRDQWTSKHEAAVKEAMIRGAVAVIEGGLDVTLDNTFLTPRTPKSIRERMQGKATFKVHSFLDVPIEECIQRDAHRLQGHVGENIIRKLAKNSSGARKGGWVLDDDWMNLWPDVEPAKMNPKAPSAVVCDLDGTLALHVDRSPYDVSRIHTDALNIPVFETLFKYYMQGAKIILLSGRDEGDAREATKEWLKSKKVNYDHLFMRQAGDKRPDYLVKYELFKQHAEPNFWVNFTFDDRDQCVALWRQLNLTCFQVGYGNF